MGTSVLGRPTVPARDPTKLSRLPGQGVLLGGLRRHLWPLLQRLQPGHESVAPPGDSEGGREACHGGVL